MTGRVTICDNALEAVAGIADGATVLVGGFGSAGQPVALVEALLEGGTSELTVVSNNAGGGDHGLAALIRDGRVRKVVCSYPRQPDSWHFDAAWRTGAIELELVPQGTLAERIRATGAGIGAFFTPTGFGTPLAEGKETRVIDGRGYVLALTGLACVSRVYTDLAVFLIQPEGIVVRDLFGVDFGTLATLVEVSLVDGTRAAAS